VLNSKYQHLSANSLQLA